MRIAVIGGGIFGSIAAFFLQENGNQVTLFEQNSSILSGASSKNQNRLHLGLHYPRDLDTALQSIVGFNDFRKYFPTACEFSFPCYYALSNCNSKTSADSYENFLKSANLEYQVVQKTRLEEFGFNLDCISHLWLCKEGVVDNDILRELIMKNLIFSKVKLSLNDKVQEVSRYKNLWRLKSSKCEDFFEVVIKATYGLDSLGKDLIGNCLSESTFQATLVIECELPMKKFGLTVVDGDFITVLPKGFTNKFLIYAPGPSVMMQSQNIEKVLSAIQNIKNVDKHTSLLVNRFKSYFPQIEITSISNRLLAVRNLESKTMASDKRVSKIEQISTNFYNIRAGKIDHATLIAREFCNLLV